MEIEIDIRYLKSVQSRFHKIKTIVEDCYKEALASLIITIPYFPRLYILPFLQRIVSEGKQKFVWSCLGQDPWEPNKCAIFPSLPFLERVEKKYITTSFAHELAHLLRIAQTPVFPYKKGNSMRKIDLQEEREVPSMFRYFREPIRTWLSEWEKISKSPEMFRKVTFKAPFRTFTSHAQFRKYLRTN